MIKELVTDQDFLSVACEPGTAKDTEVVQDLLDTYESLQGDCACIAANQIGYQKAIILVEINEKPVIMYNPKLKQAMKPYHATEGCLCLEGESNVTRFQVIKVTYQELVDGALVAREKRLTDWEAEAVQHSIDHCKGRVI